MTDIKFEAAIEKLEKVVTSCVTSEQIIVATKMVTRFERMALIGESHRAIAWRTMRCKKVVNLITRHMHENAHIFFKGNDTKGV